MPAPQDEQQRTVDADPFANSDQAEPEDVAERSRPAPSHLSEGDE